jgi:hypothetical protein
VSVFADLVQINKEMLSLDRAFKMTTDTNIRKYHQERRVPVSDDQRRLSLYQPAVYQIKVLGHPSETWSDWAGDFTISASGDENLPVALLTGCVDQAALLGLLRRFYSMGIPLISVIYLGVKWHGA